VGVFGFGFATATATTSGAVHLCAAAALAARLYYS
jgi:hypothetical protein